MSFDRLSGTTEVMFRGKRNVSLGGRLSTSIDEGYRRLDPLPERLHGRTIVVSPMDDDDKGKCTYEKYVFWVVFFYGKWSNL